MGFRHLNRDTSTRARPWTIRALVGPTIVLMLLGACGRSSQEKAGEKKMVDTIPGPSGDLHVDDGGSGGLPVVFVHSFGGSTEHWKAQLEHLRPQRRVIALDLRAHGKSATPSEDDYSVQDFAADIGAVVDGLGLDEFVLVGHSLGGSASLDYAGSHSNRVAGLLLVEAPGKMPEEQVQPILKSLDTDYDTVMKGYWEKLLAEAQPHTRSSVERGMQSVPKPVALSIIHALFEYDPVPALESYTGPKLAVITDNGNEPYALHNLVPGVPHKVIPDTSHWIHMDKPQEFNSVLDEFLASVEQETRGAAR